MFVHGPVPCLYLLDNFAALVVVGILHARPPLPPGGSAQAKARTPVFQPRGADADAVLSSARRKPGAMAPVSG